MKSQLYVVYGHQITEELTGFVRHFHQKAIEREYPGGLLRVFEDYSFMNSNKLMVCVRMDFSSVEQGKIMIEVIAGGASPGMFFGDLMGSENRRIRDFTIELGFFCKENKLRWEEQELI